MKRWWAIIACAMLALIVCAAIAFAQEAAVPEATWVGMGWYVLWSVIAIVVAAAVKRLMKKAEAYFDLEITVKNEEILTNTAVEAIGLVEEIARQNLKIGDIAAKGAVKEEQAIDFICEKLPGTIRDVASDKIHSVLPMVRAKLAGVIVGLAETKLGPKIDGD